MMANNRIEWQRKTVRKGANEKEEEVEKEYLQTKLDNKIEIEEKLTRAHTE